MTKLLLIAASGMDWGGFDAATRSGALPKLAALRGRGFSGSLTGSPVGESLAAFASLATGVQPETHGIWRHQEVWGGGLRPTGRLSWRANPIWARLEAANVSTGSVGWPAIAPGADWPGVHLDQGFVEPTGKTAEDWALPLRCAPTGAREAIALRRVHPTQITTSMIQGFVPDLVAIDQTKPSQLPALAVAMARAATIQGSAVWLMSERAPQATFVFQGILVRSAGPPRVARSRSMSTRSRPPGDSWTALSAGCRTWRGPKRWCSLFRPAGADAPASCSAQGRPSGAIPISSAAICLILRRQCSASSAGKTGR